MYLRMAEHNNYAGANYFSAFIWVIEKLDTGNIILYNHNCMYTPINPIWDIGP